MIDEHISPGLEGTRLEGAPPPRIAPGSLGTPELIRRSVERTIALGKAELELARAELRADVAAEKKGAAGVGVAGVCAIVGLSLLCVAVVFALAESIPGWAASLFVAAAVLLVGTIAGLFGRKKLRKPLERTRRTVKEDVRWAKERLA